jgi:hypothetical protein
LTEDREPRRVIDSLWDDAVQFCLAQGLWDHGGRSIEANSVPSVEPTFGFLYAFTKPDDWVRTNGVFASGDEGSPLVDYVDEAGYWYANIAPIYVRYVSNDATYGYNIGKWPATFAAYVRAHIAAEICQSLTESKASVEGLRALEHRRKGEAKGIDAMNGPARFAPEGSWVASKRGSSGGGRSRSRWDGTFQ